MKVEKFKVVKTITSVEFRCPKCAKNVITAIDDETDFYEYDNTLLNVYCPHCYSLCELNIDNETLEL